MIKFKATLGGKSQIDSVLTKMIKSLKVIPRIGETLHFSDHPLLIKYIKEFMPESGGEIPPIFVIDVIYVFEKGIFNHVWIDFDYKR